jgi:hypothetical protein
MVMEMDSIGGVEDENPLEPPTTESEHAPLTTSSSSNRKSAAAASGGIQVDDFLEIAGKTLMRAASPLVAEQLSPARVGLTAPLFVTLPAMALSRSTVLRHAKRLIHYPNCKM